MRKSSIASVLLCAWVCCIARAADPPSFSIQDDRFLLNGKPVQLVSGSIHYFRIHPEHWRDRLERCRAMGLNAIEVYVAWNVHEPYPGQYVFDGFADIERFVELAQDLDLLVLLRPGPYICAEWDFGGFPWWFGSSKVAGGRTMRLRDNDPAYLAHVDRWWAVLFGRLRRLLYQNGGPIVMVQVENEYGFCGDNKDYLRHLVHLARTHLNDDVILYTTDPPGVAGKGSIAGDEVYTVVDFGPAWFDPNGAYGVQKQMNPPGKSPPFCSEFYTGWLSHWGEQMANTSTEVLAQDTKVLLEFADSTGSLNFYMVHGGTNFGFWSGANIDGDNYMPHITSYDYDAPISEAGDYGQPGIGGPSKYHALRDVIAAHTGVEPPPPPPRPDIASYGIVGLDESVPLLRALPELSSPEGIYADLPDTMEEYGQRWGIILYRTWLPGDQLHREAVLDVSSPVHDYASVYLSSRLVGRLERSRPETNLTLPASHSALGSNDGVQLDILVEAVGRQNFGCEEGGWDFKGLTSPEVKLNGAVLHGWRVFPLSLDDVSTLDYVAGSTGGQLLAAARRSLLSASKPRRLATPDVRSGGPLFFRGELRVPQPADGGRPADTYLALHGWGKGIAWINGFNLGWYWASRGPQETLYVPGPVLRPGSNEVVLLETETAPEQAAVRFDSKPDFYGPASGARGLRAAPPDWRRRAP